MHSRQVLAWIKVSSQYRSNSQRAKEPVAHAGAPRELRAVRISEQVSTALIRFERTEDGIEFFQIDVVGIGKIGLRKQRYAPEYAHQPRWILVRQRFDQGCIDKRKDCDARGHTESQYNDGCRGEHPTVS